MKKLYVLLLAVSTVPFVFSGCSKKDPGPSYYMSAKIGNADYHVANCIAFPSGGATIIDGFLPTSRTPTYPYIIINLQNSLGSTNKIKLDNSTGSYAQLFTSSTFSSISQSGEMYITDLSGSISGTFSFTCADGTVVTDGQFTANRMQAL